ncbi:MAG: hypothetical protein K8R88_11105 [Armatimonadetes bacterium]|nr:hypothetical protein [Armatimonadota bacterium]
MAARVACTGRSIIFTPEILLNFAITRTKPYWLNGELLSETELNDLTRIPGLAEYVHAFVSIEQRILERAREAKYL